MKIKETWDFLRYSTGAFLGEFFGLFKEIKKPRTWVYFTLGIIIYGWYTSNKKLIMFSVPFLLMMYLIRQRIDGGYRKHLYEKQLIKGKGDYLVKERYEKYVVRSTQDDHVPFSFDDWKQEQIRKHHKKSNELD